MSTIWWCPRPRPVDLPLEIREGEGRSSTLSALDFPPRRPPLPRSDGEDGPPTLDATLSSRNRSSSAVHHFMKSISACWSASSCWISRRLCLVLPFFESCSCCCCWINVNEGVLTPDVLGGDGATGGGVVDASLGPRLFADRSPDKIRAGVITGPR